MKKIRIIPAPSEETRVLKVAAYCRVSSKSTAQKDSLLRQINSYIERIINHPNWEFAGIYYDFGKSGLRKKGRCRLEKMLKAVDKEEIDYILTRSVSRLSRDTLEVLTIIRYLRKRGINMHFDNENLDSISLVAEGYITLAGAVAQEESRNMSENMQWSITRKFEQGIFGNYKSFMGYKCVEGELVVVPEQAEVVRDIFKVYLSGKTFKQIKEYLEKQKIKTATEKSQWDVTTIQKMLKNEKYKGDSLLQKTYTKDYINGIREKNKGQRAQYYVKNSHLAIIDSTTFDEVQVEMFRRARLVMNEDGAQEFTGNRYSSKYVLSNLLVCGNCGAGYRRRTERGKVLWRCGTRMEKGKETCKHSPTLNDQQIKDILGKTVCNGNYDENIVKEVVERIDVYEKQIIICFFEADKYQIFEFD